VVIKIARVGDVKATHSHKGIKRMKRAIFALIAGVTLIAIINLAFAQPPEEGRGHSGPPRGRQRGGEGRDHGPPPPPPHALLEFFDTDHDRTVSTSEMEAAAEVLKKLDKNSDGKLAGQELPPPPHPPRPPRGWRHDDGPRDHGPPRGRGHRPPGPPPGEEGDEQDCPQNAGPPDEY
jgi:hypothetical protein